MSASIVDQVAGIPEQFAWVPDPEGGRLSRGGRLIIAGVGGSGMAGEFLAAAIGNGRDVVVWRDEVLPPWVQAGDTLLCVSYSGNTTETFGAWVEAGERGLRRAAVASGGKLMEAARGTGAPRASVPAGLAPRCALGYLVRAGAGLVEGVERDWTDVAAHLASVGERWRDGAAHPALIDRLLVALPALIASRGLATTAAGRWAGDLSENAKIPAMVWSMPEASHNMIMSVAPEAGHRIPLFGIALGAPREPKRRRIWDTLLGVLRDHGMHLVQIEEPHQDPWTEALGLAYAGTWVSLAVAGKAGTDPAGLSLMIELKSRLTGGAEGTTSHS